MDVSAWQDWLVIGGLFIASVLGVALTAVTLPGTWLTVAAAIIAAAVRPDMVSWSVVAWVTGIAVLAEVIEFVASALGAAKGGSTKAGVTASIGGSILGAIVGIPFLPPLGPVIGAVVGAGVAAAVAERYYAKRTWTQSGRAGAGAAVGRLLSTLAKTALAGVMGSLLVVAAAW